jgi:Cof subfamily protein (haloacid dehalogenase superfamily)
LGNDKTLYISDLDGTLLNNSAELSEHTTNTLNAMIARGLNFSVATARTPPSARRILTGLKLNSPAVLMNGVMIYDMAGERYIEVNEIKPESVCDVIRALKANGMTGLMYKLAGGEFIAYHESLETETLRDFVHERIARNIKIFRYAENLSDLTPDRVINFALIDTHERLLPVRDALADNTGLSHAMYKDTYTPDQWCLEISGANASKQNAVARLREICGYDRIVGFGDNLNDLPLFGACDVSVAVENAQPAVRDAANQICGSNDSDGVVKWLEENARI